MRVFPRFFFSPVAAEVFLPASFFSAGALPATGALPPVEGVLVAALGGILNELMIKGGERLKKRDGVRREDGKMDGRER